MQSILIVEDHAELRKRLGDWLSAEFPGSRVVAAASGEEALALAPSAQLDLVIMDIGLPGMSGIYAARALHEWNPGLPVVMLSIHEEERYRREAAEAGARAFVTKRNLRERLVPAIQGILKGSAAEEAREGRGQKP